LYVQILIAVALGVLVGRLVHHGRAAPLGELGLLVIRMLKALATPLILFAVLDAFLRTRIPARKGLRLIGFSLLNACVAIAIGLGVSNALRSGARWQAQLGSMVPHAAHTPDAHAAGGAVADAHPSLSPLANLRGYIPESLAEPFLRNNVITVVLLAVLLGAAMRTLKDRADEDQARGMAVLESGINAAFRTVALVLHWIVGLVPLAVFGMVAKLVNETGFQIFGMLGAFLVTIVLGLALHALVYYALLLRAVGRTSPVRFFRGGADAIVTALSCGSSLATLPITLKCLHERLHVSDSSARLAACVGTNLNHDGIILYEAAATLFMAQAFGVHLGLEQQVMVALSSLMAGIGIAGVPEAGLITLPLVLSAAGLPEGIAVVAIPLMTPVDWIIGRCRAATNVISDMTVATLLDRLEPQGAPVGLSAPQPSAAPATAGTGTGAG
jgi:DAACS family dicarboxylate/amino acid:cation (Na+ or H+) symporter